MLIALAILALLSSVAILPIDTTPLVSSPHPAADYAEATARYDALQRAERDSVMADGASLMLVHGQRTSRAIVLVHGLTNSPRQFHELAQQFYDSGYNVIVPRLPQHGLLSGDVAQLKTLTAEKYRDYADRSVDVAHGLGDSVFVLGLSAGGNVAAWIAQRRPDVSRVLVVAPALALAHIPHMLQSPAMNAAERVPNITIRQAPDTLRPHAYFGVSTRGVGETLRFAATVLEDAEQHAPLVLDLGVVVNDHDRTVDASAALGLAARWTRSTGRQTTMYRFDELLGLPHDVVDVSQKCGMPPLVYSVLIALMEGRIPPPVATAVVRCKPVPEAES